MTRGVWVAFALLPASCAGRSGQDAGSPLLTLEAAPDLTVQPIPAGQRVLRYPYPAGYTPSHFGSAPAPTPLPVLPPRKPARILGDLRFIAPGSGLGGVALSPDGKRLALGTCIFDAAGGELDAAYDSEGNAVHKLAFSPDGARLYCGEGPSPNVPTHGTTLAIRDVPGKRQLLKIDASDWGLSGDGRLLVTCMHAAVRVYDTQSWKAVAAYRVRGPRPTAVALSPDGERILVGCDDGAVRVWDRATGREVAVLHELREVPSPHYKPIVHLIAFSPDGKTLAAANARPHDPLTPRQVAWWRWPDCSLIHKSTKLDDDPTDLRFSPDTKYLFGDIWSTTSVWDVKTGEVRKELNRYRDKRTLSAVSFAAADRVFAVSGCRPALLGFPSLDSMPWPDRPFDNHEPKLPFELDGPGPSSDTREKRFSEILLPDGSRLRRSNLTQSTDWGIQLIGPNGQLVHYFEKGRVVRFDVTPDGKLLAAYGHNANGQGFDFPLRFWDVATGKEVAAIRVDPQPGDVMRFSPDGKRLAVRHADGLVRVWDVAGCKLLMALDPDGYWPDRLTFSKDGRSLVGSVAGLPVLVVWGVADDGDRMR